MGAGEEKPQKPPPNQRSPEETASLLSRAVWWWLTPLFALAATGRLTADELHALSDKDESAYSTKRFLDSWEQEVARARRAAAQPRLWRVLARAFGVEFLQTGIPLKPFWLGFVLVQVFAVKGLVRSLAKGGSAARPQLLLAWVVMACLGVEGQSLCQHHLFRGTQRLGMRVRTALNGAVFRKLLVLRAADLSAAGLSSGALQNLIISDARRLEEAITYSHFAWHTIPELAVIFALAVYAAGLPALAGAAVILILVQLSRSMASAVGRQRKKAIAATDVRVRLTKEVLTAARAVKLNGWVPPLARRLAACRAAESAPLRAAAQLRASSSTLRDIPSVAAALATFAAVAALSPGGRLQPEKVFTVLALFGAVVRILAIAPMGLQSLAESQSGMQRMAELMLLPHGSEPAALPPPQEEPAEGVSVCEGGGGEEKGDEGYPLQLRGSYAWCYQPEQAPAAATTQSNPLAEKGDVDASPDLESPPLQSAAERDAQSGWLHDLDIRIAKGTLTAVVGPVGSGKSSLLLALLGELHPVPPAAASDARLAPRRRLVGRCAYAPQEAWVLNATLRDNILLRRGVDEKRYSDVLDACCLRPDLATLPAGDGTEVGERGVTLSGGQRSRLALARAVYSRPSVLLLDDPLAAVDAGTSRHLVEQCLRGPLLEGSTRLLVTHSPAVLQLCDSVLLLQRGRVIYHGPPQTVQSPERPLSAAGALALPPAAAAALRRSLDEESVPLSLDDMPAAAAAAPAEPAVTHTLVKGEAGGEGEVTWQTYTAYYHAAGGFPVALAITLAYIMQGAVALLTYLWLAWWSDNTYNLSTAVNIGVFAALVGGSAAMSLARARGLTAAMLRASSSLHDSVLEHVLRSPVSFFDSTPVGRILNRFSRDLEVLDTELPVALQACGELFAGALASFALVAAILPYFALCFPLMVFVGARLRARYVVLSRELKRMDGVSRSPVISHFGVTLAGLPCVRAYALGASFEAQFSRLMDANSRAHWLFVCSGRWVGIRLDMLAAAAAAAAAACVAGAREGGHGPGALSIPPGLAGMALVVSLTFAGTLQYAIRQMSELENAMTSVERLVAFSQLPTEASPASPPGLLPPNWPTHGAVEFDKLTVSYSPDLPPTLNGVSFTIPAGAKLGLLGRTGAGKSTLISALFRLVENEGCSGRILIDGIDISRVGLDDLRRSLSLIPQDPVLFQGTLANNLDPFGISTPEIVAALIPRLGLAARAGEAGGDAEIAEAGDNWSQGERQLVCLGRALLRQSRLLVCDEPSSNLDLAADARMQDAIRTDFAASTVIVIAHRLESIMASDLVAVLAPGGALCELGAPAELLETGGGSAFARFGDAGGEEQAGRLRAQARAAAEARKTR